MVSVAIGVVVFLAALVVVARARRDETITMPGAGRPAAHARTVEELILAGRKIDAIKLLRQQTGLGLKEAKGEAERLQRSLQPQ